MQGTTNKEALTKLKKSTTKRLKKISVSSYRLERADARLTAYVCECIDNPDRHNLYELLAVFRFFQFLDKFEFRTKEIRKFIVFYEKLKFSGTKGRVRYKLTPIQVFQFSNIFGFYYPGTNKRVIREVLFFVPRKFSKTTSVASLAIYDMLFGDANAQAYVAANSYDQAKVCFDEIRNILIALDTKLRKFKINREKIYNRIKGKTSFARCLASNPDTLDGLNASVVIVDEYSQAESAALKNVLTSSMGARLNPLTIVITTASSKQVTPFVDMLKGYKAILRGEHQNDSIFAHIFEPDVDDLDEGSPALWRKVQPHLGVTVYEDFYKAEYQKALYSADDALEFRTKLLNVFAEDITTVWITSKQIEDQFKKIPIESIGYLPTMCAVDLSVHDDFSTVTYNVYTAKTKAFHSFTDYYFPAGALAKHPNRELYQNWADQGYLILIPGDVIDYDRIVADILGRAKYLEILGIGYDAYKSIEFVNLLSASIKNASDFVSPVKQTYGTFTSPVESFELALYRGKQTFDPNPITAWCFGNAVLDEDKMRNKKPIKKTHNLKIDPVITNLMTYHLFNNLTQ